LAVRHFIFVNIGSHKLQFDARWNDVAGARFRDGATKGVEESMRPFILAISAVAGIAMGSSLQSAGAIPLANPNGLDAAQQNVATLDQVHCVPGWPHHYPTSWRRANGCSRYYRGGAVIIGPRFGFRSWGYGRRFHGGRHFFGGRHFRRGWR